jgi:hypothetical protein
MNGDKETFINPTAPVSDAAPSGSQSVKRKPKKKATDKRSEAPAHVDLETVLEKLSGCVFHFKCCITPS